MPNKKLFISYKSENVMLVRSVVDELIGHGLDVWFAEYEVLSNQYDSFTATLDASLQQAITDSSGAILFTSRLWGESLHCQQELSWVSQRWSVEPQRVVQICMSDDALFGLPQQQTDQLRPFHAMSVRTSDVFDPENIASFIFAHLATEINYSPLRLQYSLRPCSIEHEGYWASIQLPNVCEPKYFTQHLTKKKSEGYHWDSELDERPLKVDITMSPRESLLSPWELAVRQGTDASEPRSTLDDRAVYANLRKAASEWLHHHNYFEQGLHLFWLDSLGMMAITCLERCHQSDKLIWRRVYLILVIDNQTGTIGQVNISLGVEFASQDEERTLRDFARLSPTLDKTAGTLVYIGQPKRFLNEVFYSLLFWAPIFTGLTWFFLPMLPFWLQCTIGLCGSVLWLPWAMDKLVPARNAMFRPACQVRFYRSPNYDFSFQVPVGWRVATGMAERALNMFRPADAEVHCVPIGRWRMEPRFSVYVLPTTLSEVTASFREYCLDKQVEVRNDHAIVVDNIGAHECIYAVRHNGKVHKYYRVHLEYQGNVYLFLASLNNYESELPAISRCVNSFRFGSSSPKAVDKAL